MQCSFHSLDDEIKRLLLNNDVKFIKCYTREDNFIYKIPKIGALLCRFLNLLELKKSSKYINYVQHANTLFKLYIFSTFHLDISGNVIKDWQ